MHLNPIKGAFPHKDQHDRTAVVAADSTAIERGSVIRVNSNGEFEIASDAKVFPMFLALQGYKDLQATMAGFFGQGVGPVVDPDKPVSKGPAISGIHMDDGDVWETDMFDTTVADSKWVINAKLTVKNGLITVAEAEGDDNVVGYLVKAPTFRYINNAPTASGIMTGESRRVIQFQCGR